MLQTYRKFGIEINVLNNDQVKEQWKGNHFVVSCLFVFFGDFSASI